MTAFLPQDDDYRGRLDFTLWRRIIAHAAPYRFELLCLCGSGLLVALIDVMFPVITAWMIDEAIENGLTARLGWYGAFYAGLIGGLCCFVFLFILFAGRIATGIAHDLRERGFARLQELSFSYYDVRPVGWLVTRLTADCSKLSSLIPWFMLDLVWGSAFIMGIAVAMLLLHWPLALFVLAIVPPLIGVSIYFQSRLLESSRLARKHNSQITASLNECIMGVRTTKTLVREEQNLREFTQLTTGLYTHSTRNALQSAVYLPLVICFGSVGVGLALWHGGIRLGGDISLGTLVAFMQFAGLFYMPIQELSRRFTDLQSAQAAAERIQGLLDTEPEIRDREGLVDLAAHQSERIESLRFEHVTFAYKPGEPVLRNFSLDVRAGQTVALVGATGGGKSTIVSLLARFYEPTEGRILINGIDYRERTLHWLQSRLGVVLQTPHLFRGTIRENIRYGRLTATDAEVEAAAHLANARAFIEESTDGYDTQVGEGGAHLSVGQRQLVALARAVLADPQIFILDEATSSVDTEAEHAIQAGIDRVLKGRIAFVIAHRLSTIRAADLILVIDGGRIIEQGTHAELLRQRGRYHALSTRQFRKEREAAELLAG